MLLDVLLEDRILFELLPCGLIFQKFNDLAGWAGTSPAWEKCPPRMRHSRVGVLVRGDLEAASTGRLDQLNGRLHLPPEIPTSNLEVIDVNRNPGHLSHPDGLADLLNQLVAFAAHMSAVVAAGLGRELPTEWFLQDIRD